MRKWISFTISDNFVLRRRFRPKRPADPVPPSPVVYTTDQIGKFRIQNAAAAGYLVYIGVDQMPNLAGNYDQFSTTLPISFGYALPGSGIEVLYVVVRYRNTFGLISQNVKPWILTLTPDGVVFNDLPAPQQVAVYPRQNGVLRILGRYPTFTVDNPPADQLKVWIATSPPNVETDPETATLNIISEQFMYDLGVFTPDTYYVVCGLYRKSDERLSPTVSKQVVILEEPAAPEIF